MDGGIFILVSRDGKKETLLQKAIMILIILNALMIKIIMFILWLRQIMQHNFIYTEQNWMEKENWNCFHLPNHEGYS